MFLRVLVQWLIFGLILRGLWSLFRVLLGGSRVMRNEGRHSSAESSDKRKKAKKPPWDPKDVVDVRYEEVTRESKTS